MRQPDSPELPQQPQEPDLAEPLIEEARLSGVSLASERRPGISIVDCLLHDCDMANLDARGASWRRVGLTGGRMTGCNLSEATLVDVSIENCRSDLVALAASRLERVRFTSCNLSQADLQEARLRSVAFEDCDLREADLSRARFDDVELRGCQLEGIRGAEKMDGIGMPWTDVVANAGLFAAACGVKVLE